ncbi:MAG: Beta-galactosidase [Ignavibacteriae bacterium]|nr:MAG: Beta-galactosidase [Ignavibacteriota bacterium]
MRIYNVVGQLISTLVDANQRAGMYEAIWDARKYPSGIYYAKLETEGFVAVQKLVYIR